LARVSPTPSSPLERACTLPWRAGGVCLRTSKRRARRRASRGVCEAWTVRYHPHSRWDICILFVLKRARVNATVVSLQVFPSVPVHWTCSHRLYEASHVQPTALSRDDKSPIIYFPQVPLNYKYISPMQYHRPTQNIPEHHDSTTLPATFCKELQASTSATPHLRL